MLSWIWGGRSHTAQTTDFYRALKSNSNGIRFSITNATTRQMPILYQDRAGISLYDAQYPNPEGPRVPIPEETIQQVLDRLHRFKITCEEDFNVPPGPENIHVLATEATRTAPNSEEFRERIRQRTGWVVRLLKKEEEGRVGAMGVVATCGKPTAGLIMDLGGGSTQITWVIVEEGADGGITTSPRWSFSFPYGAAALKTQLEQSKETGQKEKLKEEMTKKFQQAYRDLEVPDSLLRRARAQGGLDLYLCGGGFRGWGYLLMEQDSANPYPIPIINGYRVHKEKFHDTASVLEKVSDPEIKIFGVSKRRASQVPAVAFLVNVLADALPDIQNIQFSQGGVREGFLFDQLPMNIRSEDPLVAATRPYATSSADAFQSLLSAVLPASTSMSTLAPPSSFSQPLLSALANLLFVHSPVPKESRCAAALHSTTSGILASANSLTHTDRALLALLLRERWDGDLAPTDQSLHSRLRQCVSAQEAWWCRYLGRVATLIGDVYPSGRVPETESRWRIQLDAQWNSTPTKDNKQNKEEKGEKPEMLQLRVRLNGGGLQDGISDHAERIEKAGKKKQRIEGYGAKVEVSILRIDRR